MRVAALPRARAGFSLARGEAGDAVLDRHRPRPLCARALGELLQKEWGQPVVVEAKPGGNGFIAVEQVKKAAPDGHELLVLANSHLTINPSLFKNVPYDPKIGRASCRERV